ncbi:MAG: AAA family ATPase, partial [Dehalococcoidia bacterium]|nr:AAA family ATPase [Dehalococcoidia bacterium]
MIKKLRLTNFKGIEQGEIEFSPLTILVGSNNSGKTTVLEALFLAPNPFRKVVYGGTSFDIVQGLHQTLDSNGVATLLLNYRADHAKIECEIDGDSYFLEFVLEKDQVFFTSNKQNPEKSGIVFGQSGTRLRAFAAASKSGGSR